MIGGPKTRGERITKRVAAGVLGLVLAFLYAPFLIMLLLSFQESQAAMFPPEQFTFVSYQKLFEPNNYELFTIAGEPLTDYLPPLTLSLGRASRRRPVGKGSRRP